MSSTKLLCRYQYDPLDRLTGLKPLERSDTQRFYQGNDLVNEIEGQEQLTIMRNEAQPLAQRHSVGDVTKTTLLATDQQHSVLQTRTATDTHHLAYTAYGHHPVESGLSSLLGFNGERPDSVTGHYLLGQGKRAFNPVLMRFNSPDELSPFGEGGINPYTYCGGDPVNRYDPSGNAPFFRPWTAPTYFRPWTGRLQHQTQAISRTPRVPTTWQSQRAQTSAATESSNPFPRGASKEVSAKFKFLPEGRPRRRAPQKKPRSDKRQRELDFHTELSSDSRGYDALVPPHGPEVVDPDLLKTYASNLTEKNMLLEVEQVSRKQIYDIDQKIRRSLKYVKQDIYRKYIRGIRTQ